MQTCGGLCKVFESFRRLRQGSVVLHAATSPVTTRLQFELILRTVEADHFQRVAAVSWFLTGCVAQRHVSCDGASRFG